MSGRALKIAMTLLGRDMTELKSTTNKMVDGLEESVVHINDNVNKQTKHLKVIVEDTVEMKAQVLTKQLAGLMGEMANTKNTKVWSFTLITLKKIQ